MELGTVMFPWWFNTHRMLRLLSLLIFIHLCCLVRCLIWSLVNMYARLTSAPHPSFFYDLHTIFSIFHAYHMQIHPSLVPPSSLDLALLSLSLSLRNTMRLKSRVLSLQLCATRHTTVSFTNGPLPKGNFEYGSKLWEVSGCVECIKSGQKQGDMLLIVPEGAYARGQDLCPRGDIKRLGCTQHQHRRHSLTPVRRREPGRAPLLSIC